MKNELRIIGGTWRSRKLKFPDAQGLRPTADRIRETLFNWLGQNLEGLSCLDLFAGSGALGFEAASRLARRVVQVEQDRAVCQALKANCELLGATPVAVVQADVLRFLQGAPEAFQIVFMDPPFQLGGHAQVCRLLEDRGWLAPMARIYVESPSSHTLEDLPESWQILRAKKAGAVDYRLYQRTA